jgi:alkanesulfonate monooxygenase SsuD/methylene tetrahydromethanopterin reductase-like flavin-dependent oxidoreductase (luciferase family)
VGKDPEAFPNGLATMWFHITDDENEVERIFQERLLPTIRRPVEILRDRLPVGSPESFAEKLLAYRDAGVQRVFIWPVTDEHRQLELFHDKVAPLVTP